jgi:methylated-DNA-[protein]-cysteine S-methyltransferase
MKKQKEVYIGEVNPTPLGPIWVAVSDLGLVALEFVDNEAAFVERLQQRGFRVTRDDSQLASLAVQQVSDYLLGRRREFDLPIDWGEMTSFQKKVLQATFAIPCGQVVTYGELAQKIGRIGAARAVGRAEATNPIPLVIPCHRVIGADGGLHGYGGRGGLETKAWLLRLEGVQIKAVV